MNKVIAVIQWFSKFLISIFGFITAPIMMPIVYLYMGGKDGDLARSNFLWYWYDDEDGFFGTDWFREAKGYDMTNAWGRFRCAYHWLGFRNNAWNLQTTVKAPVGEKEILSMKGRIVRIHNNKVIELPLMEFARLKYVSAEGDYQDNTGEYLSLEHSYLGHTMCWYKVNGKLYFRKSFAGEKWGRRIEFHLGTSDHRVVFRLKIKKLIPIYEVVIK